MATRLRNTLVGITLLAALAPSSAALAGHFANRNAEWSWTELSRRVDGCRSAVIRTRSTAKQAAFVSPEEPSWGRIRPSGTAERSPARRR